MLDVKVKEDIAKEGCCGTYFPPLPHSSPLVSGQHCHLNFHPWSQVRVLQ